MDIFSLVVGIFIGLFSFVFVGIFKINKKVERLEDKVKELDTLKEVPFDTKEIL